MFTFNVFGIRENHVNLDKMINSNGGVIYYGTYNNESEVGEILKKFETAYYSNIAFNKKTSIVYGNEFSINVASYEEVSEGNINLLLGKTTQTFKLNDNQYYIRKITPEGNKVIVIVEGKEYEFDLKKGENVYFIIAQDDKNLK